MFSLRLINATVRLLKQSVVMALITVSTKKRHQSWIFTNDFCEIVYFFMLLHPIV